MTCRSPALAPCVCEYDESAFTIITTAAKSGCVAHRPACGAVLAPSISVAQRLLVVASTLGLSRKAFTVLALRSPSVGILQKGVTRVPLIFAPGLIMAASGCISTAVLRNRYSVVNIEGIHFPPSYLVPVLGKAGVPCSWWCQPPS
ncbi:hypothetical protein H920_00053 [Fukomys damarensis]|uniref:Uncharacterized protein n=1 Tax=Fukomys damarensis TaxID=885580 RepID=A0A091CMY5_FUKDA|nr:hypothetical protein H920_19342 [Fukomys damarensis]KFO38542.1 hypothetical protein H920_00053 [Fukomys damarensis]